MHSSRLFAPASLILVLLVTMAPSRSAAPADPAALREVSRIRAHFDSVLAELGSRDIAALSETQRARRGHLMVTLKGYRDGGGVSAQLRFPRGPHTLLHRSQDRHASTIMRMW